MTERSYTKGDKRPTPWAAFNKNFVLWSLVRSPASTPTWRKRGGDWIAHLHADDKGKPRVRAWLPIDQEPRLPSARDVSLLLQVLRLTVLKTTDEDYAAALAVGGQAIKHNRELRKELEAKGHDTDGLRHPRYVGKVLFKGAWDRRRSKRKRHKGELPVPELSFPSERSAMIAFGRNPKKQGEWEQVVRSLELWRDLSVRYRPWVGKVRTGDGDFPGFLEFTLDPITIRLSAEFFASRLGYTLKVDLPVAVDERSAVQFNLALYLSNWLEHHRDDTVAHKIGLDRLCRLIGLASDARIEQRRCIRHAVKRINRTRILRNQYIVTFGKDKQMCAFMLAGAEIDAYRKDPDRDDLSREDQRRVHFAKLAMEGLEDKVAERAMEAEGL